MTPAPPTPPLRPDWTIAVLSGFVLFFSLGTAAVSIFSPGSKDLLSTLVQQVTLFTGALLLWLKPKS